MQVRDHAALRPACSGCGARCHVKDWQSRQVATLFGTVAVRLPRFRCPACGRNEAGTSWPAHCRSTPELDQLQAHLSALLTYRVATGVLAHLLPVAAGTSHETLRGRTLKLGEQLRHAAAGVPEPAIAAAAPTSAITLSLDSTFSFTALRRLAMRFRGILRGGKAAKLEAWLRDARASGIGALRRFARMLGRDLEAVRNAITESWSYGQTEGQINKLKTLKRTTYGRAGAELLRARLLPLEIAEYARRVKQTPINCSATHAGSTAVARGRADRQLGRCNGLFLV